MNIFEGLINRDYLSRDTIIISEHEMNIKPVNGIATGSKQI